MTGTQKEVVRGSVYIALSIILIGIIGSVFQESGIKRANDYTDKAIKKHYSESDSIMQTKVDLIITIISK